MQALVLSGNRVALERREDPREAPGEVVARMRLAGICGTDLELAKGYMGFAGVLGHELLADVDGRRVAVEINAACRSCDWCARGLAVHCPRRTVLGILGRDGAFAERVLVPRANLHEIPRGLDDERAVFTEPLAAALHILDDVAPARGDRVAVVGDGRLGLLSAMVLARTGAEVLVLGRHASHLAIAERAGASTALEQDVADRSAFDVVVDATGSPRGLARALELLKPRGALVLKSTFAARDPIDLAPIVINEIKVFGSRCGSFPRAIEALASRAIDPAPLVSARYPLARAEEAFARAGERGTLKVIISG